MELTILMPCLNEALTIGTCIEKAQAFVSRTGVNAEILISDNGSTDGSIQIAESLGARVVNAPERGYGAALMCGIQAARGRFVIMGDADDSYEFSTLDAFLARLRAGDDLVMGNRFRGGIAPGAMPPLHRYLGNPVLSLLGRTFFNIPVGDFHCGLRGFAREAMLRLALVSPGMEFATEMVAKAARAGLIISEVPTTLKPDGRDRPPHLRTWRDGWRHLLFMLLFSPVWLFFAPGLALSVVGLLAFGVLSMGPIRLGSLGFDVHSLLYSSGAIVIGFLMVQFGLLITWIGAISGLVPAGKWLRRFNQSVSVEWGLLFGAALFVAGVIWSVYLTGRWTGDGFTELEPRHAMRSVIPAVTMMVVGLQVCASSLLAAALHLTWKTLKKH